MRARILGARGRVVQNGLERPMCSYSHVRGGRSLMDWFILKWGEHKQRYLFWESDISLHKIAVVFV